MSDLVTGDLVEHLRMLFDYDRWANDKIFAAASTLAEAKLEESAGASFDSVRGNMAHIFTAQLTWYYRLAQQEPEPALTTTIAELRAGFAAAHARWDALLSGMSDADARQPLEYRDSEGVDRNRPLSVVFAHVVNHGTFHRGETGMILARLGHSPGDLDIPYFFDDWRPTRGTL